MTENNESIWRRCPHYESQRVAAHPFDCIFQYGTTYISQTRTPPLQKTHSSLSRHIYLETESHDRLHKSSLVWTLRSSGILSSSHPSIVADSPRRSTPRSTSEHQMAGPGLSRSGEIESCKILSASQQIPCQFSSLAPISTLGIWTFSTSPNI